MSRKIWLAALSLGILGFQSTLAAQQFTIELKNGTTFLSRYPPEEAPWDSTKIVFLSEFGNLISISTAEVASVKSEAELKGFGHMLNATTIALGWAPNDAIDPDSEEGRSQAALDRYYEALGAANQPAQPASVEQFVDPSQAGQSGQSGLAYGMWGLGAAPPPPPPPLMPMPLPPGASAPAIPTEPAPPVDQ